MDGKSLAGCPKRNSCLHLTWLLRKQQGTNVFKSFPRDETMTGADPGFSFGGGGGRKRLYARTHITSITTPTHFFIRPQNLLVNFPDPESRGTHRTSPTSLTSKKKRRKKREKGNTAPAKSLISMNNQYTTRLHTTPKSWGGGDI